MAKSAALIPSWAATVGAMRDHKCDVQVTCTHCRVCRKVDAAGLAERMGDEYSLIDRRCRCRLTDGCAGWNSFHYLHGVMRPLRTEAAVERWIAIDGRNARLSR